MAVWCNLQRAIRENGGLSGWKVEPGCIQHFSSQQKEAIEWGHSKVNLEAKTHQQDDRGLRRLWQSEVNGRAVLKEKCG